MTPRTTVVIATFNRRRLLEETLDSVRHQSRPAHLIVVDDYSTDGTREFLQAQTDIQAILLDRNSERAIARNTGIAAVNTEFLLVLDDDDLLNPTAVGELEDLADRFPKAACAIGGWTPFTTTSAPTPMNPQRVAAGRWWREFLLAWNPATAGQVLFRTKAVQLLGGFDLNYPGVDDFELLMRLSYQADIALTPSPVLRYRIHPGQQKQADLSYDYRARVAFVSSVATHDRSEAQTLLDLRDTFFRAIQSRDRLGRVALRNVLRKAPWTLLSPITGIVVVRLCLSALATRLLPRRFVARVQSRFGR